MQAHAIVSGARSAPPAPARYASRLAGHRARSTIIPRRLDNNCHLGPSTGSRVPVHVVRASSGEQESRPRDVSVCAQPRDVSASAIVTDVTADAYDVRMPSYARTGKNFLNISIPTLLNADLGSVMDPPSCALTPKKTHIVCTLGPSSRTVDDLEKLLFAGMSVARFNFSHGTHEYHLECLNNLRQACMNTGKVCAVLLDTKGPEIRTGTLEDGKPVTLERGKELTLTTDYSVVGNKDLLAVSYQWMARDVKAGDNILMADGSVMLEVMATDVDAGTVRVKCLNSATIGERKNCNLPGVAVDLPTLTEKDLHDIIGFGVVHDVDFIAASFVRKGSDVLKIRDVLDNAGGSSIRIISKVENHEGLCNYDDILRLSDGIMVARGDLGVEMPPEDVPIVQKEIIEECRRQGKPVIVATQMLESMIDSPAPTRAECSDVATAIFDGCDAIMLSGESAAGKYPEESVRMQQRLVRRVEASTRHRELVRMGNIGGYEPPHGETDTDAVVEAAANLARSLDAKCLLVFTRTGSSARRLARLKPGLPILAVTPSVDVARSLALSAYVYPAVLDPAAVDAERANLFFKMLEAGLDVARRKHLVRDPTDRIVCTAGLPFNVEGCANAIRVVEAAGLDCWGGQCIWEG